MPPDDAERVAEQYKNMAIYGNSGKYLYPDGYAWLEEILDELWQTEARATASRCLRIY